MSTPDPLYAQGQVHNFREAIEYMCSEPATAFLSDEELAARVVMAGYDNWGEDVTIAALESLAMDGIAGHAPRPSDVTPREQAEAIYRRMPESEKVDLLAGVCTIIVREVRAAARQPGSPFLPDGGHRGHR